jgi:transposase
VLLITPGNAHDMRAARQCIEALPPSAELVGDKGYDSNDLRSWLIERGTRPVIPPKRHRKDKLDFDPEIYRQRNVIERMFCRFKDWRRVATRFDRNIKTFMATVAIAATVIWWLK